MDVEAGSHRSELSHSNRIERTRGNFLAGHQNAHLKFDIKTPINNHALKLLEVGTDHRQDCLYVRCDINRPFWRGRALPDGRQC